MSESYLGSSLDLYIKQLPTASSAHIFRSTFSTCTEMYSAFPNTMQQMQALQADINRLQDDNMRLRTERFALQAEINGLKAEVQALNQQLAAGHRVYATPGVWALPSALESMWIKGNHFRDANLMLNWYVIVTAVRAFNADKFCSSRDGCQRQTFDPTCFREGHMAWCGTHDRTITGKWSSCSVSTEQKPDCFPVEWGELHVLKRNCLATNHSVEERTDADWRAIINRAASEGKIGKRGVPHDVLDHLFFPSYRRH